MKTLLLEFEKLWNKVIDIKSEHALTKKTIGTSGGIAHFTNIEVLYSMLPLGGEDAVVGEKGDNHAVLRLYNSAYVNDPEEGRFLGSSGGNNAIIKDFRDDGEIGGDVASQENVEPPATRGLDFSVYVGSLTLRTDDLDLWRAYSKDGDGFCIVTPFSCFDQDQMEIEDDLVSPKLYEVRYGKTRALKTVTSLRNSLQKIKQRRENICGRKSEVDRRLVRKHFNRTVMEILSNISFLYKNDHFKNEGEVRILASYTIDDPAVRLDDTSKLYVKTTNFLFHQGSKIIIGPKVTDPIKTRLDLRHRLDRNRHTDVEVKRSRIRYR